MDLDSYKLEDLKSVRNQLENLNSSIITLFRIKYAAIFSVLVYSLSNQNPFIALLPPFIAFPIYIIANGYHKNICRKAAYIIVFYGMEVAPEWELRLRKYNMDKPKESDKMSKLSVSSYIGEFVAALIAFILTRPQYLNHLRDHPDLYQNPINNFIAYDYSIIILLMIYTILSVVIYRYKVNYKNEREECIQKWRRVKMQEKTD